MNKIDKEEWKIIAGLAAFSAVWILFVVPYLTGSADWNSMNPVLQYMLYNLGFILFTVASFGAILTMAFKQKFNTSNAFRNGISSWLGFSWVIDMWQPPNYIDTMGNVVITNAAALPNTSVDGMFVYIFDTLMPFLKTTVVPFFNVSAEWVVVYMAVPLLTVTMVAYILSNGQFRTWMNQKGHSH